jgi:hypothetical protein
MIIFLSRIIVSLNSSMMLKLLVLGRLRLMNNSTPKPINR